MRCCECILVVILMVARTNLYTNENQTKTIVINPSDSDEIIEAKE